ncbi:phospholipase D-like domain-containing protein [Nocardioides stalactiti]|uniref:phospholipase D-like domain-containing protein n=1 Tax=Nocardioides stalactiti TaxID=2755356 RepID=UPI001603D960|nr:phospholipase D-like domain-containing protein [Nocardioides stalactiti]
MRRVAAPLAILLAILLPLTLRPTAAPASAPAPAPASADRYEPGGGPTFNVPNPWGNAAENTRIVRKVEEAFRHVRRTADDPHPVILVTGYLFDRKLSADALIAACRRGVSVRVIIDRDVVARPLRELVTILNADNVRDRDRNDVADNDARAGRCNRALPFDEDGLRRGEGAIPLMSVEEARRSVSEPTGREVTWGSDGSYVLRCSGSCRGARDANVHSKFYAMSNTGSARNVVMVSSSNLNGGGAKLGWNDLVVMKNRPATFGFLRDVHRLMTAQRPAGRELLELVDGPYTTRVFPIDGAKANDPLLRDLRRIRCTSDLGRTTLHIQQFWWNGHRGNYLWDKIRRLARDGCEVHIIIGAVDRRLGRKMRDARRAGLVDFWDSRIDTDDDGYVNTRTHMKSIAVRGTYGDDRRYAGVWTGTANWSNGSLTRGDENTVNIESRSLWRRYVDYWQVVRNHSHR